MRKWAWVLALAALGGCIVHKRTTVEAPAGPPLTRDEVERMAAAGIAEGVILELIDQRGAKRLSADDLVALKQAGASDAVIQKMIAAEVKAPEVVVVHDPVYYYYYDPYYPYYYWGPSWGFTFGYGYYRHRSFIGAYRLRR